MKVKIKKKMMFLITFLIINYPVAGFFALEWNRIKCLEKENHIPLSFVCDDDNDCGNNSDEDFCTEWQNTDCPKGEARCIRKDLDACIDIPFYCQVTDPPCMGSLDPRICEMVIARQIMNISSMATPTILPQINLTMSPTEGRKEEAPNDLVVPVDLDECPGNYTRVGNECFSLYSVLKMIELRNTSCSPGEAHCTRNGEGICISIYAYCDMVNPPCSGDLDFRMCKILNNKTLQSYPDIETANKINIEDDTSGNMTSLQCRNDLFFLVGEECVTIYNLLESVLWASCSCNTGYKRCTRNGFSSCIPTSLFCELSDPLCNNKIDYACKVLNDPILTSHPSILSLSNASVIASNSAPNEGKSQDGTSAITTSANAMLNLVCPEMYTLVGTECLSVYYVMEMVEWRERSCNRCEMCKRKGKSYCLPLRFYCDMVDPPCEGDVDPRICTILRSEELKALSSPQEPFNATEYGLRTKSSIEDEHLLIASSNVTLTHPKCPNLFTRIGSKCVSVFFLTKVGWGEARAICKIIGGELLSFASSQDWDFHASLLKHLYDIGMTGDFWLGGKYAHDTLAWTWLDGTPMTLGSPYWGVRYMNDCSERDGNQTSTQRFYWNQQGSSCSHYHKAPKSMDTHFCAAMTFKHYFYITDEFCFNLKSPLCVIADIAG